MVGRKRLVKQDSKNPVQLFKGGFELNVLPQLLHHAVLDILGVLGADGVAVEAVRMTNVTKSDVTLLEKPLC